MLLYYITDRSQFAGDETSRCRALLSKIAEAASAGVDYIQLREKDLTGRELEAIAHEAVRIIRDNVGRAPSTAPHPLVPRTENREPGTQFLINSRTDIAIAVSADGVHLRRNDISPADVRRVWSFCGADAPARERPVIGISCHTREDVIRAETEGADFAVFAPVFEKKGAATAGITALHRACQAKIPVFALGGVTVENAQACRDAGAGGIAGIRLFQENEIEAVVRALRGGAGGDAASRVSTLT